MRVQGLQAPDCALRTLDWARDGSHLMVSGDGRQLAVIDAAGARRVRHARRKRGEREKWGAFQAGLLTVHACNLLRIPCPLSAQSMRSVRNVSWATHTSPLGFAVMGTAEGDDYGTPPSVLDRWDWGRDGGGLGA